jgi:hypothetical protein
MTPFHNIKYFLPIACFMLFFGSCTEPIDIKTANSEPVIVIYGCLSEDTVYQNIRVTMSSPYFELEPNQPVSNAIVSIQSSDNQIFELIETAEKGLYQTTTPMAAVTGITYQLTVSVDPDQNGILTHYEATATMQKPYPIDSIKIEEMYIMGYKHYFLNLYAQEEEGPDYYCARAIINDSLQSVKLSRYAAFSDLSIDGKYLDGLTIFMLEDYENEQVDDNPVNIFVKPGDKITFCISLIEKGYHDFILQCQNEQRGENPFFGGPASNITTNISNGGIGYFATFSTTRLDAYVP